MSTTLWAFALTQWYHWMQFTCYSQLSGILVNESFFHSIGFYMVETHWCSKSSWLFHNFSPWNSWFPSPNEPLFFPKQMWRMNTSTNSAMLVNFRISTVNPKNSSDFCWIHNWCIEFAHRRSHVTWIHWRRFYDLGKLTVLRVGKRYCQKNTRFFCVQYTKC